MWTATTRCLTAGARYASFSECVWSKPFLFLFQAAANFYTANARLLWNGHAIIGKDGVTKAFQELPSTKHTVLSFDCQPVLATSEQYVLVAVTGQVTYGGDKESHTFTQTFMLVGQGNVFMINNDEFRFV